MRGEYWTTYGIRLVRNAGAEHAVPIPECEFYNETDAAQFGAQLFEQDATIDEVDMVVINYHRDVAASRPIVARRHTPRG